MLFKPLSLALYTRPGVRDCLKALQGGPEGLLQAPSNCIPFHGLLYLTSLFAGLFHNFGS